MKLISSNYLHRQAEELISLPGENDNSYAFPTNTITLTVIGFDVCWLDLHILNVTVVSARREYIPKNQIRQRSLM